MTIVQLNTQKYGSTWMPLKHQPLFLLFLGSLLLYKSFPWWIYQFDSTVALPDAGIWAVILLAILVFLIVLALSAYISQVILKSLGFPTFSSMVSQFKKLSLWQQFVFYGLGYALLFWGAIACLIALC